MLGLSLIHVSKRGIGIFALQNGQFVAEKFSQVVPRESVDEFFKLKSNITVGGHLDDYAFSN